MTTTRRRQLVVLWVVAAVGLGGALLAAQIDINPLDDPDLAMQRPGFLDAHHDPFPAPTVASGVPALGQQTVVFFIRPAFARDLGTALTRNTALRQRAALAVVVSGAATPDTISGIPMVADPEGRLAAAFMLDTPRDGGSPVGYAVVDSRGQVRYRTLDPELANRLDEVETIVRATP